MNDLHFTAENTEAQRDKVTSPKTHSTNVSQDLSQVFLIRS